MTSAGEEFIIFHMSRKVCILKGSPRPEGNTNSLLKPVISELTRADAECEEFNLYDMDIRPCLACRGCQGDWSAPACVLNDDMGGIFSSMLSSELILLATPIYVWYCTAPMKACLDRAAYALNKYYGDEKGPSLWAGKKIALISTCGYRPEKGADLLEEGLKRYCKHSGLQYLGKIAERHLGYNVEFMDAEKEQRARNFGRRLLREL